jgi:hypothetical protein
VITETVLPPTWILQALTCSGGGEDTTWSLANKAATVNLDFGEDVVCTFTNKAVPGERFTGGGSFFPNYTDTNPQFPGTIPDPDGEGTVSAFSAVRLTHGFQLHCNKEIDPNHIEINWASGNNTQRGRSAENNFQLNTAKYPGSLTAANCSDDITGGRYKNSNNPNQGVQTGGIDEESPDSTVDTYEAWGYGRFNNVNNAIIHFMLTDAGEPGKDRDEIWVVIYVNNAGVPGAELLRIGGNWDAQSSTHNTLMTAGQRDLIVPNGTNGPVDDRTVLKNGADIQSGNQQAHKGL